MIRWANAAPRWDHTQWLHAQNYLISVSEITCQTDMNIQHSLSFNRVSSFSLFCSLNQGVFLRYRSIVYEAEIIIKDSGYISNVH
jgi:hypothetical protein